MPEKLLNAALFQIGWFACVLGGNSLWLLVAFAVMLAHLAWKRSWRSEGPLLVIILLIGASIDSLLLNAGVFHFPQGGHLVPLWLALLWPLLGITLNHCLAWTARPWWLASLLGAVSAPFSYYAGSKLAGVELPLGLWPTMGVLAVVWAGVFPGLHWIARRCDFWK